MLNKWTKLFLKLGLLNSRSLAPKAVIVNEIIIDNSFNVLCLTETWLKQNYFIGLNEPNKLLLQAWAPSDWSWQRCCNNIEIFSMSLRKQDTGLSISFEILLFNVWLTFCLICGTIFGSAPTYFHSLLRIYIPSRSLRSASERRLVVPSQRGSKSLSRTFSFTIPGWWNDLPTPIRNAGSLSIFKPQLKTHLFQLYLTSS